MILTSLPFIDTPAPGIEFDSVVSDSRQARPGCLFAAVRGNHDDGGIYAAAAVKAGATAILCDANSRENMERLRVPVVTAPDVRLAMAHLASLVSGNPSASMDVFAVTGTNGKTSVAWMLAEMLRADGRMPGLQTTVAVEYAQTSLPSARTTPGSCEFQQLLSVMLAAGCDSVVTEASSHALDQQRLAAVRLAGGIFTNLTEDHLDYHKTMAAYFTAKKKLFAQLAQTTPGAPAVICVSAPGGEEMAEYAKTLPLRVLRVGIGDAPDHFLQAQGLQMDNGNCSFRLCCGAQQAEITTALAGRYNVANLICAGAMAIAAGVEFNAVAEVMRRVRPRWGRLERVSCALPFSVYVDYAHTDDALRNVLSALREICRGKLIVVFGCGGDRDRGKRPLMGRACAEGADCMVVTSDNPRSEDPMSIIGEILSGVPKTAKCIVEPDRRAAIVRAIQLAGAGDAVLIAGKGHETEQVCAGTTIHFDDREEARAEIARLEAKFKSGIC